MKKIIPIILCVAVLSACGGNHINNESITLNTRPDQANILVQTEIQTETKAELLEELTEDDYKEICNELYYDDIFFGETNLEGEYIKLHVFLSEKMYFTSNNMLSDTFKQYDNLYDLNKDFYKCCILRKDTTSYVGQQINMWFSNNYELNPGDYKTGQKIIVYGQIISWNNNTMNGYNSVTIIPKYIENEE